MSFSSEDDGDRARLRRYRDAMCESEYEFPEPVVDGAGKWVIEALIVGAGIAAVSWFGIGAIMIAALR